LIDYIAIPKYLSDNVISCKVDDSCSYAISDHFPVIMSVNEELCNNDTTTLPNGGLHKWNKATVDNIKMYSDETANLLLSIE